MSELLSIKEVADLTGLHEITIRRYVRSGELEAVRIGRRIRVRRAALDNLLKPMPPAATPESAAESIVDLKESAAIYLVAESGISPLRIPAVIGKVATGLAQLPVEDIAMVAQLVARLQQQRQPVAPRLSPAEMVAEARRQAALLRDVPRTEVAARFDALSEEIRGQAVARGTAIEGDWFGD